MRLCMCAWITIWQTLVTWSLYIVIHIHICMYTVCRPTYPHMHVRVVPIHSDS